MRIVFRLLSWAFLVLTVLVAGGFVLAYYLMNRSQPDYGASFSMMGLEGEVEIIRDANAVPHIYATTDADAYFALGVAHAQERLWQMELTRRGAQGRLSELFGAAAFDIDHQMRALDLHGLAQRSQRNQSHETMAALEAYSDGVNE